MIKNNFASESSHFAFAKRVDLSMMPPENENLFSLFFENRSWKKWNFEIDLYTIEGSKPVQAEASNHSSVVNNNTSYISEDKDDVFENIGNEEVDKTEYHNIMVATDDSIRLEYLFQNLLDHGFQMLAVGETGTGKTQSLKKFLSLSLMRGGWEQGEMVLSATSTPSSVR